MFTPVSNTGSNKGGKIVAAIVVFVLLAIIGFGAYRYSNCDKNDNGVSYTTGKSESGTYTNDWAEIKIDVTGKIKDYSSMAGESNYRSTVEGLKGSVKSQNVDVETNFIGAVDIKVGSATYQLPAIVMITISDNSINSKLFGAKIETFFDETDLSRVALPAGYSFVHESDMLICGHSYKTYCVTMPYDQTTNMKMYMCIRTIGNKMVLFYFYDIPDIVDINTIKRSFIS